VSDRYRRGLENRAGIFNHPCRGSEIVQGFFDVEESL